MSETPAWLTAMREELSNMNWVDQFVAASHWMTLVTTEVLPELGTVRRTATAQQLLVPGWDATRLAETVGTRPSIMERLGEEGRRILRREARLIDTEEDGG